MFVYDKKIRQANIFEIEQIVKNRLLSDLDRFHRNSDEAIEQMKNNMLTLQQPIGRYKLATSIEDNAEYLSKVTEEVVTVEATQCIGKWHDIEYSLGTATGKLFFARNENIRLNDAVLRYTCPRISNNIFTEEELSNLQKIEKECIAITEKGGTYYIDIKKEEAYIDGNDKFILLYLEDEYLTKYSYYAIMAWLKSSLFIWYMIKNVGSLRLYEPSVFKQIVFPHIIALEKGNEIENIVKEIIEAEKYFLDKINQCWDSSTEEELDVFINEHNDMIEGFSKQIDDILFNAMNVNERQKKIIAEDLAASNVFNYL